MLEQGQGRGVSNKEYPAPLAKYQDVVANRQLFMTTLEKLHATMGTKFMIPIIGGRDLDLHKLFLEVTSRGGIDKILREKRWKDVTATFNFPSTATNASFVLRKYYYSLLQQYEHVYYLKPQGWNPSPNGALQSPHNTAVAAHGLPKMLPPSTQLQSVPQSRVTPIELGGDAATPVGSPVIGVIDGKFESGYLITVTIGKEKLKGVMYQAPSAPNPLNQMPQMSGLKAPTMTTLGMRRRRRRRRKKSEIRKRDPAHPKPNRSGYNFFFSEQHARLKPLYPGKDREISRMIGELWNDLQDDQKSIYQEKAIRDKERYQMEMEKYRERIRANQVINEAVPIQQRFPHLNAMEGTGREFPDENESNSSKSESEEGEGEEEDDIDKDDEYENLSDASLADCSSGAVDLGNVNADGYQNKGCEQSQGQKQPQQYTITSMT